MNIDRYDHPIPKKYRAKRVKQHPYSWRQPPEYYCNHCKRAYTVAIGPTFSPCKKCVVLDQILTGART